MDDRQLTGTKRKRGARRARGVLLPGLLWVTLAVHGQTFEEGLTAYRDGDHERARTVWIEAAEIGDSRSMFSLGSLYAKGTGIERDPEAAYSWFLRAAEAGLPQAQYNVAYMLEQGRGVEADTDAALAWYERAARTGLPQAQAAYAVRLWNGRGIEPDPEAALHWFQAAARQGHAEAQNSLGTMLEGGIGTRADPVAAVTWYRRAAEQDVPEAQASLARLYRSGIGVEADAEQADYWEARARGERADEPPPSAVATSKPASVGPKPAPALEAAVVAKAAEKPVAPPAPKAPPEPERAVRAGSVAAAAGRETQTTDAAPKPAADAAGWFDTAPANHLTTQLIGSRDPKALRRFIDRHGLGADAALLQMARNDGGTWYMVVYGSFPDRAAAKTAIAGLPQKVQKNKPWIRTIADVRKAIGR
jgi:TPR repeat protein